MARLITILHIYYHDQTAYLIGKLGNINGCEWDLIVTYSEYNAETCDRILKFKPDTVFEQVENVGYDVWPFIKVLREHDLSGYDYVLKLHTKSPCRKGERLNGMRLREYEWRDLLVDSILKSPAHFRKCLRILDNDPSVGLVCSYELYKGLSHGLPEDQSRLRCEADRVGLDVSNGHFCAGTMFLARLSALGRIKRIKLDDDMWGRHMKSHSRGSLAHVYERLLGIMIKDAGYRVKCVMTYPLRTFAVFMHNLFSPVLQFIFSINGDEFGRKYILLFGMKLYLGK